MNAPILSHTCMHLVCTAGEGSFVFNEHCYQIEKNDLVVMTNPSRAKNLVAHPDLKVEWFAADYLTSTAKILHFSYRLIINHIRYDVRIFG